MRTLAIAALITLMAAPASAGGWGALNSLNDGYQAGEQQQLCLNALRLYTERLGPPPPPMCAAPSVPLPAYTYQRPTRCYWLGQPNMPGAQWVCQ